jgi:HK97 gp10 family phage protein
MAIETKVDIRELDKLADDIAKANSKTKRNINGAIHKFAILIDAKSKEKIQKGTRSGRTYRRRSVVHQASAPGEPPKTDTGRLVASIRPVFGNMSAEVGSLANIAKYGEFLEQGTKNMAARPWLEPTLQENQGELGNLITAAIKSGGLAE